MASVTGRILFVQESRIRLLDDRGRGHVLVLASDAPFEAQDLSPLTGARIHLDVDGAPGLEARIIRDLHLLEASS